MRDSDRVGCSLHSQPPVLPRPNVFLCCDPAVASFGCNYNGLPPPENASTGFLNTSGSVADVVPFMHVGGWPGDPSWGVAGNTIPYHVWKAPYSSP